MSPRWVIEVDREAREARGVYRRAIEFGSRMDPRTMVGIIPVGCGGGVGELLMCCCEVQN
jgi:hypothetical protein